MPAASTTAAAAALAQSGEGGLPTIVLLGLVAGVSFLGFRWVFRRQSRQRREQDEADTDNPDERP